MTSPKSPYAIPIPILLLKTKSTPNDSYEEYFSSTSSLPLFAPIFVPVLEHRSDVQNLEVVKRSLRDGGDGALKGRKMGRYGGMIFTSQRAVEGFAGVVEELEGEQRIAARSAKEDVEMKKSREGGKELSMIYPSCITFYCFLRDITDFIGHCFFSSVPPRHLFCLSICLPISIYQAISNSKLTSSLCSFQPSLNPNLHLIPLPIPLRSFPSTQSAPPHPVPSTPSSRPHPPCSHTSIPKSWGPTRETVKP
jgi:hypothetical protein